MPLKESYEVALRRMGYYKICKTNRFFIFLFFFFFSFSLIFNAKRLFLYLMHVTSFVVNTPIFLTINSVYTRTIKIKIILPKYNAQGKR